MIEVDPVLIDVLQPEVWVEVSYTLKEDYDGDIVEDCLNGYVIDVKDSMWQVGDEVITFGGEPCVVQSVRLAVDI